MEEHCYIIGEPLFGTEFREIFYAPVGQADLALGILKGIKNADEAVARLREEYLAIVYALKEMGIDFRIIYAHEDKVDEKVLSVCIQGLDCRLVGFAPDFFPPSVIYPRDFITVIGKIILMNSQIAAWQVAESSGYKLISSYFGEGGRVLACGETMLVGERLVLEEGRTVDSQEEIDKIKDLGIRVAAIPLSISQEYSTKGKEKIFVSDHQDRTACLIRGKDNGLHLVADPYLCVADYEAGSPWAPLLPKESLDLLRRKCDPLGIQVHCPKRMSVPYALNLVQFPDGRVLMTAGDNDVAETIGGIIGEDKVCKTPISIELFPVWCYAGIRCLINEAPQVLFKKVQYSGDSLSKRDE